MSKRKQESSTLDETNYREYAQRVIQKYNEKGMIVDALLWSRIIALYETALKAKTYPESYERRTP